MQEPGICLVAQRSKRLLLGTECFEYDANHYLITALDVPVIAEVTGASKEEPYLGLTLKIDFTAPLIIGRGHMLTIRQNLLCGYVTASHRLCLYILLCVIPVVSTAEPDA
jgi:hypothetical protein